jgi:GNAT superfamily N-acetyltransferase
MVEVKRSRPTSTLRHENEADQLRAIKPLWDALQKHHSKVTPDLGGSTPKRELEDSWRRWRTKYESWLRDPDTFFVIAEVEDRPVGYAFVTVGAGYAGWQTGDRLAMLETLSVLPGHRGNGVGTALLEFIWEHLAEIGVKELSITVTKSNVDSHRFYERHGFVQGFVVYYGKRDNQAPQN